MTQPKFKLNDQARCINVGNNGYLRVGIIKVELVEGQFDE